jgi:hypothetical protein
LGKLRGGEEFLLEFLDAGGGDGDCRHAGVFGRLQLVAALEACGSGAGTKAC